MVLDYYLWDENVRVKLIVDCQEKIFEKDMERLVNINNEWEVR